MEITLGSIVFLKSNPEQQMTVEEIISTDERLEELQIDGLDATAINDVLCRWFVKAELHKNAFPSYMLQLVPQK